MFNEEKYIKYYLNKTISTIDNDIKKKQKEYDDFEFSYEKTQKKIDSLFEDQISLKCDMSALDKFRENEKKLNNLLSKPFDKNILEKEMNKKTNLLLEIESLKWARLYFC